MNLQRHPELIDRLAAAYALGTLRGGARRRFETVARQSALVRAAALLWQERFAAMTELQRHEAPSPNVWKRIQNELDAQQPVAQPSQVAAPMLDKLRRSLGLWRGAALVASLAALGVAINALNLSSTLDARTSQLVQLQAKPEIQYVAVLADDKASASMLVTFDPKHNRLTLKRVGGFQESADKSLQLWALPSVAGAGPRSLGVLGGGAVVRLTAAENQVREAPALAISLEPKGGVPEGSGPSGPVLFKGALLQAPV